MSEQTLIERLRGDNCVCRMAREAADEIETVNGELRKAMDGIQKLCVENERVHREVRAVLAAIADCPRCKGTGHGAGTTDGITPFPCGYCGPYRAALSHSAVPKP